MYYKYNNHNIYYEKYGNFKKNIIILPGWGETRKTFDSMINKLKKEYTVYIIDYPGFGYSSYIKKELTIYDYSNIVYNFIKDNKIKNITIISHSFGGRISSILIGKNKLKIDKLILLDVAGIKRIKIKILLKRYLYKILKFITIFFPLNTKYKLRKKLFNYFSSSDYKVLPKYMYNTFKNIIKENLYKYYKNITIPTLIIWGEKDKDTPLKDGILLNKKIKNSKLLIYNNCSHFTYLEEANIINNEIYSFIKKED